ncbi:DUF1508 domain-containing protein [Arthrobacter sp. NPDC093128]|uniref:YegP family protein n=1 Tax=Arthrobacter sp. NPDC093128 TaxID=3154979 RepID=UPI0034225B48
MAGKFEVFVDAAAQYRFRLTAPDGKELAVSAAFSDKAAAVAGIEAVRECAGMGLISDLCPAGVPVPAALLAVPVPPVCEPRRATVDAVRIHATARRAAAAPHWSGAA